MQTFERHVDERRVDVNMIKFRLSGWGTVWKYCSLTTQFSSRETDFQLNLNSWLRESFECIYVITVDHPEVEREAWEAGTSHSKQFQSKSNNFNP